MKRVVIFLVFLLIVPIISAEITITTNQLIYNLGNSLIVDVSVIEDNNFDGLFKLTLLCENYKLPYFLTPVSIESSFRTAISAPDLVITQLMLGNCIIIGSLETYSGLVLEEQKSNSFFITNQLIMLPIQNKITLLPSETLQISGVLNEAFGNNVIKAQTTFALDDNSYKSEAFDGKFNFTLELPKNIKSGKHVLEISASDYKSNLGTSSVEIEIIAVPSYIKIDLNSNEFAPGSKILITTSLFDQANDLINASLDLELTSPTGHKIFRKAVQSNEKIEYELSQYAEPGSYVLAGTYNNLLIKSSINVTSIREVKLKYENETVFIENIGNVPFEDDIALILKSGLEKYSINKHVKVEPGQLINLELSKEVPSGIYDILVFIKEGLTLLSEKISEVQNIGLQENLSNFLAEKEGVLASHVLIHDNRPIYKKVSSGLSSISLALVGADGILAKNPILAPMILIVILLLIILRFGRKPIMKLFKKKKNDED